MHYTLKRITDEHPEWLDALKKRCYTVNGCCHIVHKDLGPFLNEYMYQDALAIALEEKQISFLREYYFGVDFHGHRIAHKHFVDFLVDDKVFVECKAIEHLGVEQRQQLWNYMRLTSTEIGILYNFAPIKDECERYYLDTQSGIMYAF